MMKVVAEEPNETENSVSGSQKSKKSKRKANTSMQSAQGLPRDLEGADAKKSVSSMPTNEKDEALAAGKVSAMTEKKSSGHPKKRSDSTPDRS